MDWIMWGLIIATLAATWVFWIRPILKVTPSLAHFYLQEESLWAAIKLKFAGIKQKLTVAAFTVTAFIVSAYDFLQPLVAQSGVDVTTLTSKVPAQAWPIIGMGMLALVTYFRRLSDQRNAAALDEAHAQIAALTVAAPVAPAPVK